ncbi:MAG: PIN domain nuclease [Microbacterium sp.]|nr:MAG: PIN domain nuclease [Microbacterium sp.]
MTALLLDTHVVVWLATEPERVPAGLRARLQSAEHLAVSAASAYEIAQKVRSGRMPGATGIVARWDELVAAMMAEDVALTSADMAHAAGLAWEHRDPFDRMLVAQAQRRGFTLATRDAAIRAYRGVECAAWE